MSEHTPLRFGPRGGETARSASSVSPGTHGFSAKGTESVWDDSASLRASARTSWIAKFLGRLATVSLAMIFFGFPLFFLSLTSQGLIFEKQMFFYFWLLLGLVGWVSRGIVTGELVVRRTPLDIPVLVFWATVGISCIFSVDKWHSLWGFFGDPSRGFLNVTALTLAYFFISSHINVRRFPIFLFAMLLSGTLVAIWTALAFFGIRFLPEALLAFAPLSLFGTMKSLTLFFGILLPLFLVGIVLLFRGFTVRNALFWSLLVGLSIGITLSLYILLAVYSFTPWIAILSGVCLFLIYVLAQVVQLGDRFNWLPMALFIVVLVCLMIGPQGNAFLSKKTTILPEVALDPSASWSIAIEGLKERLIVGSGPATYGYNFSLHKPDTLNIGLQNNFRFYQGGSFFLEVMPTVGVVGGFFFLLLILTFLGVGFVGLSRERERNKMLSLGVWASSLVFVVAMFTMPLDGSILVYGALVAMLAIPILLEESGRGDETIRLSLKASPKFALALAFTFMTVSAGVAFLFAFIGKAFLADIHAGRASRLAATEVNDEAFSSMARALSLVPYEGRYYATLGQMYMALVNREAAKPESERDLDLIKTTVERSAVPLVDEAMRRMPNDAFIHEVAGQVYENVSLLAGSDPEVLARTGNVYRRALDLEPKNPSFYVKLGLINRVLANRDDKKSVRTELLNESKEYFTTALERKPDFVAGYLNRGLTEEALGNVGAAVDDLEKARRIAPSVDASFHLARILQVRGSEEDLARAEQVSLDALKRNDKSINILLNLGFVYEKKKNTEKAIETYGKLSELFKGDGFDDAKKQVETLIENVRSGKGNLSPTPSLPETSETRTEIPPETENATDAEPVLPTPVSPSETPELPILPDAPTP